MVAKYRREAVENIAKAETSVCSCSHKAGRGRRPISGIILTHYEAEAYGRNAQFYQLSCTMYKTCNATNDFNTSIQALYVHRMRVIHVQCISFIHTAQSNKKTSFIFRLNKMHVENSVREF